MKLDSKKTMTLVAAIATMAMATFAWTGCDSDDEKGGQTTTDAGGGGHTSPYPACNAITSSCHEVDVGEGEIHDCHDKAHAAKSEADCTGIKDRCLQICAEAKADAGAADDEDGGEHEGDSGH